MTVPTISKSIAFPMAPCIAALAPLAPRRASSPASTKACARPPSLAPEGIASIAVDGWAVDYVRLDPDGQPLHDPFCYRDERTIAAKQNADAIFRLRSLSPHRRAATAHQHRLSVACRSQPERCQHAPWICLPEYVLHWLGAPRVAEYTNATHTGLVDLATGNWACDLFAWLGLPHRGRAAHRSAPARRLGRLQGPLSALAAFRDTELIAPACHDTASAIAGIPADLDSTAYICSGTWSLVGTLMLRAHHHAARPSPPATPTRARLPADSASTPTSTACGC